MSVDIERLHAFLGKAVGDLGAAISATLVLVGDELGFYRTLAAGPLSSADLAKRTDTSERYVREWLANQAAGGYVEYDAASDTYSLNEEQALCLADPDGPADLPGAYALVEAVFHAKPRTLEHFRNGQGMEWGEHHPCLFRGCERFFRGGYSANLVGSWLPALEGVVDKLGKGGAGSGRRLRPRRQHDPDGEIVPELDLRRLRLPCPFDRRCAGARQDGRRAERQL